MGLMFAARPRRHVGRERGGREDDADRSDVSYGVKRLDPEHERGHRTAQRHGRDEPDDDAYCAQREPMQHEHPLELPRLGAERRPNTDFPRPLRHDIRYDAVNPDDAERQTR